MKEFSNYWSTGTSWYIKKRSSELMRSLLLVAVIVSTKALLLLIATACIYVGRHNQLVAENPETQVISEYLKQYDAGFYLQLAREGYVEGSSACAFYPLWPAAIRLGVFITGGTPSVVSIVLANAFSTVAALLFHGFVERRFGRKIAMQTLVLLISLPGALFYSISYSESLYFLLLLGCFWGLELKRYSWSAVSAFLLPLVRPVGVFVVLPLIWYAYELRRTRLIPTKLSSDDVKKGEEPPNLTIFVDRISCVNLLALFPLLGYAMYFAVIYAWTGNSFEGFQAQKAFPNSPAVGNIFNFAGFWDAFLNAKTLTGMTDSLLDRGLFIMFLCLLPSVYRLNRTWFWYALPTGLIPAMTNWFISYRRYIIICFPLFIIGAQFFDKAHRRWMFWYYVALLAALQFWVIKEFSSSHWVG